MTKSKPADARKTNSTLLTLVALCERFGEADEDRRAEAALLATDLLRDSGLTWTSVLSALFDGNSESLKLRALPTDTWRADHLIKACLQAAKTAEKIRPFDERFLDGMEDLLSRFGFETELSDRQWTVLFHIARRLRVLEGRPS
jgi:hypothetical protein